jgi:hypothetical protein
LFSEGIAPSPITAVADLSTVADASAVSAVTIAATTNGLSAAAAAGSLKQTLTAPQHFAYPLPVDKEVQNNETLIKLEQLIESYPQIPLRKPVALKTRFKGADRSTKKGSQDTLPSPEIRAILVIVLRVLQLGKECEITI